MTVYTSKVSVPHGYFKKDKSTYRDWRFAIFRELIQNSSDAGATDLSFYLSKLDDEHIHLTCLDNGLGMDRNIIENILLSLGGSYKDTGSIGGFGYAKIILFFAHTKYQIKTRDLIVNGSGCDYVITNNSEYVNGTHIQVWIEDSYNISTYIHKLKKTLDYSHLRKVKNITINGEQYTNKPKKYDYKLETNIGLLQFSDNEESKMSTLWVRIDGLTMFEHTFYNEKKKSFIGILDLNKTSIEILTSNRDSLLYEYERSLNEVIKMLSEDREKFDNSKYYEHTLNIRPLEHFIDFINQKIIEQVITKEEGDSYVKKYSENLHVEHTSKQEKEEPSLIIKNDPNNRIQIVEQPNPFNKIIKDFKKVEERINKKIIKIDESKYPLNFKIKKEMEKDIFKKLCQKRNYVLAHQWDKLVKLIFCIPNFEYMGVNYSLKDPFLSDGMLLYRDCPIYTGFIFSEVSTMRACFFNNKDSYQVLLNPELIEKDMCFEDLLDIAIHECCHFLNMYHDEDFCISLFEVARSFRKHYNLRKVKSFIKF